jgi:hypothetical protein
MIRRRLISVCVVALLSIVLMGQDCPAQSGLCDPDPCATIPNAVAGTCSEIGGSCTGPSDYMCSCDSGYTWQSATHTCEEEPPDVLIAGVSPSAAAHGAQVTIDGIGFAGTTSVSIGGQEQTFAEQSDERIIIYRLSFLTPMGTQDLVITASVSQSFT